MLRSNVSASPDIFSSRLTVSISVGAVILLVFYKCSCHLRCSSKDYHKCLVSSPKQTRYCAKTVLLQEMCVADRERMAVFRVPVTAMNTLLQVSEKACSYKLTCISIRFGKGAIPPDREINNSLFALRRSK